MTWRPGCPAPGWACEFDRLMGGEGTALPAGTPAGLPFTGLVLPLLQEARERLLAQLKGMAGHGDAFDADLLTEQLYAPLPVLRGGLIQNQDPPARRPSGQG